MHQFMVAFQVRGLHAVQPARLDGKRRRLGQAVRGQRFRPLPRPLLFRHLRQRPSLIQELDQLDRRGLEPDARHSKPRLYQQQNAKHVPTDGGMRRKVCRTLSRKRASGGRDERHLFAVCHRCDRHDSLWDQSGLFGRTQQQLLHHGTRIGKFGLVQIVKVIILAKFAAIGKVRGYSLGGQV
jgi:hypothetical protein